MRQLAGVGDASQGEWREMGNRAFHLRRRLSAAEQQEVGPAVDIRRSIEAWQRALMVEDRIHLASPEVLADELGR